MNLTTTTDGAILEFLSIHPQPIRTLVDRYPKATIYARLRVLQAGGLVAKRGRQYLLTTAGLQAKAAHEGGQAFDGLVEAYPPLREVPSPQHRALAELGMGALVLRQLTDQDEHHTGFLLVGPSLTWKSSAGRFLCLAAGADLATCLVDLAAEAGRSLWIRRDATGDIRSQRGLLSAAVVVLDEYGLADRAVRRAVLPLLSGRRRVPLEHDVLPITPVPIITMNPRPGQSLTARTGFSLPQLRRLVPCDLGAVRLPDLALTGERALDAARAAGPLTLRAPKGTCEACREAVVRLLRQVLVPDALSIVDVELLLGLGRGLTGWLTPATALRQVLYDFLLIVETVGWVKPGWLDLVRSFPDRREEAAVSIGARGAAMLPALPASLSPTISLFPERVDLSRQKEHAAMNSRDSVLPTFTLSERSKALLVWLAENAGISLDEAVYLLIELYRMQQEFNDNDLDDLRAVVQLREACGAANIAISDLRTAVELTGGLRARGLTLDHLQTTLQVAADLAEAGLYLEDAVAVVELMKALKKAGINARLPEQLGAALKRYDALGYEPKQLGRVAKLWEQLKALNLGLDDLEHPLAQYRQLAELGLDARAVADLATAFDLAGVPAVQRAEVLGNAITLGQAGIALAGLQAEREACLQELRQRQAEQALLEETLKASRDEFARIQQEAAEAKERVAALREKAATQEDAIATTGALEQFFRGNLDAADPFFAKVVTLRQLRRTRPGQFPNFETGLSVAIQAQLRRFLTVITEAALAAPALGSTDPSAKE
ncbi:MAG TPA: hypothetical protein VFE48_23305 [Methylomirabilota bacterium]|nr:hypothetical protein [Methylomirabilota bacterium]